MLAVGKGMVLVYIGLLFPLLAGIGWKAVKREEHHGILYGYLLGSLTVWAVFFAVARYVITGKKTLAELSHIWMSVVLVWSVGIIFFLVMKKKFREEPRKIGIKKMLPGVLLVAALTVVCVGFSVNEQQDHTVENVLTMYVTDSLYEYNPMNGKEKDQLLSLEAEALELQAKSPLDALYAVEAYGVRVNPGKLVRVMLPVFFLPFYVCVYAAWGHYLFGENAGKRYLFQAVVWFLYAIPLVAERDVVFQVYTNCWNGETLFFLGLLPLAVLLLLGERDTSRTLSDFKQPYLIAEYLICALAGQLLYTKGFFFVTFIWGTVLIVLGIKRWKDGSSNTTVKRTI